MSKTNNSMAFDVKGWIRRLDSLPPTPPRPKRTTVASPQATITRIEQPETVPHSVDAFAHTPTVPIAMEESLVPISGNAEYLSKADHHDSDGPQEHHSSGSTMSYSPETYKEPSEEVAQIDKSVSTSYSWVFVESDERPAPIVCADTVDKASDVSSEAILVANPMLTGQRNNCSDTKSDDHEDREVTEVLSHSPLGEPPDANVDVLRQDTQPSNDVRAAISEIEEIGVCAQEDSTVAITEKECDSGYQQSLRILPFSPTPTVQAAGWGKSYSEGTDPTRMRCVTLTRLPPTSTARTVASLVWGGLISSINYTFASSAATVYFVNASDCIRYYGEVAHGIDFPGDSLRIVQVDISMTDEPISDHVRKLVDCGCTRCVRAMGIDRSWNVKELSELAQARGRRLEHVTLKNLPGGVCVIDVCLRAALN